MYHQNETNRHFELRDLDKNAAEALRIVPAEEALRTRQASRYLLLVLLGILFGGILAWLL